MSRFDFKLAVGAISKEAVEAVFSVAQNQDVPLGLIVSKNQIDYDYGYVNGWTTERFMGYIDAMRMLYPRAEVAICRDHCGPGFKETSNGQDVALTIQTDIELGFDLIHVDMCRLPGSDEDRLKATLRTLEFIRELDGNIGIEVGTEENQGIAATDLSRLDWETDAIQKICQPVFYTVQTGSLVKNACQIGSFDEVAMTYAAELLHDKGMKVKEHNADYLTPDEIRARGGLVDAMNIAPELGTIQTATFLDLCRDWRINTHGWAEEVRDKEQWVKWVQYPLELNVPLMLHMAGHYHYTSYRYQQMEAQLQKTLGNLRFWLTGPMGRRIHEYLTNRKALGMGRDPRAE
jgi:hypothetical protein